MTSQPVPSTPPPRHDHLGADVSRPERLTSGIAGIVGIVLIGGVIFLGDLPQTSGEGATSIEAWLQRPRAGNAATVAVALSAVSYLFMFIFFAGIYRVVSSWQPRSIVPTVFAFGGAGFLIGAMVSDAMIWSVPLTRETTDGVDVPAGLLVVMDRAWLVALVEAQLGLVAALLAIAIAGVRARRLGLRVPLTLLVVLGVGIVAIVPLLAAPTVQTVFLASNQTRFLCLVALAIWLILRKRPLTEQLPA